MPAGSIQVAAVPLELALALGIRFSSGLGVAASGNQRNLLQRNLLTQDSTASQGRLRSALC